MFLLKIFTIENFSLAMYTLFDKLSGEFFVFEVEKGVVAHLSIEVVLVLGEL